MHVYILYNDDWQVFHISCSFVPFIEDMVHLCCAGTTRKRPKIVRVKKSMKQRTDSATKCKMKEKTASTSSIYTHILPGFIILDNVNNLFSHSVPHGDIF